MTNLIGQSLGRYHILEQLGEGGMAVVYKAYDTRLERNVAIKVILPQKQHTEKFIKRFEREAKSLAQLSHPNIVNVIDYGDHEGLPYLVMEYLSGGTLKQKLAGKPMPWQEAIRLLMPIARALSYAHDHKIVHRDVKPGNILITESGEPMLSDFGIAKILEAEETMDLTGTGVGVGTPEYMSPEQAQGKPIDARSDVYSLGVVLYEMVTGRRPYQADTPMAVIWKLASDPLPRPNSFTPNLPDAIEQTILKALAKLSEDRFQSMGDFAVSLGRLTSGNAPKEKLANNGGRLNKRGYILWMTIIAGMSVIWLLSTLILKDKILATVFHTEIPYMQTVTEIVSQETKIPSTKTSAATKTSTPINPIAITTTATTLISIPDGIPPVSRVIRSESFDNIAIDFIVDKNYSLSNGIISFEDPITSGDVWADGSAGMITSYPIKLGNGYLLLFRAKLKSQYIISLEDGSFDQTRYRAFWLLNGKSISIWTGRNENLNRLLDFQIKNEVWHYLLLRRYSEGFEGVVWEKDNPGIIHYFNAVTGSGWAGNNLVFTVNVPAGTVEVDEFRELEFSIDPSIPLSK